MSTAISGLNTTLYCGETASTLKNCATLRMCPT